VVEAGVHQGDPIAERYQGGGFVTIDFTSPDKRPSRLSRSAK